MQSSQAFFYRFLSLFIDYKFDLKSYKIFWRFYYINARIIEQLFERNTRNIVTNNCNDNISQII